MANHPAAPRTLWNPPPLTRGEPRERDLLLDRFPGFFDGIGLPTLAALLDVPRLRLRPSGLVSRLAPAPAGGVFVALAAREIRFVLHLPPSLASRLVTAALGGGIAAPGEGLSTGEEGALIYALDRGARDWLRGGGGAFEIRGALADGRQVADYLGSAPRWRCVADVDGPGLTERVEVLAAGFPEAWGPGRRERRGLGPVACWPGELRIVAGTSRLPAADLEGLEPGDRVVLDEGCHPMCKPALSFALLRSGDLYIEGRWLDERRIEVVSAEDGIQEMKHMTETNDEIRAAFEPAGGVDAASLELVVEVEVGRLRMTVEQAAALLPGRVLTLGRGVGPEVDLVVGTRNIGRGQLCEHDGELAVEILELR
jgi:type III secretion system YscQ/HrcQ family protein